MKNPSIARLNRNENRETTNATPDARASVSNTTGTVMISEFVKCVVKFPRRHASA